jgi:hypothetical protein
MQVWSVTAVSTCSVTSSDVTYLRVVLLYMWSLANGPDKNLVSVGCVKLVCRLSCPILLMSEFIFLFSILSVDGGGTRPKTWR